MSFRTVLRSGGLVLVVAACALGEDSGSAGREIPAAFRPLDYLVGSWKGAGVPSANKVRGWSESQAWAWKFEKGKPVGLSFTAKDDKVLAKGQVSFDASTKKYVLSGSDAAGKAVSFTGVLDARGKTLTLDRVGTTADGTKQRLSITPNGNFIRYTMTLLEQERGAPRFKKMIDVGVTKEGEAFAAGSTAENMPKCIITGGTATMSVSYKGGSYPLCCTGCRDEFNENPEKYIKKLALRNAAAAKPGSKAAATGANKDDGSFEGLGDDAKPEASPRKQ